MQVHKTNAARILDKIPVHYDLVPYSVNEDHLDAIHVAEQLGQPIEKVFKTILVRGDKSGVFVCVIPGDLEVNLKNAASVSGNKKVETVAVKELFPLTGYIRGGCSPIGMKKKYPVYLDKQSLNYSSIYISAGQRGLQLKLSPTDLVQVVDATICSLTGTNS